MLQNHSINHFLQSTCRFITTEEHAKEVKDELGDHILNYVEAYTAEGLNENEAVAKALKQMGDPNQLSYLYKELLPSKSRIICAALLAILLLLFCSATIYEGLIDGTLWIDIPFALMITSCYGLYVIILIRTHKKAKSLLNKNPLFYIQSYKKTTLDEWLSKGILYFAFFSIGLTVLVYIADLKEVSQSELIPYAIESFTSTIPLILLCLLFATFISQNKHSVAYEDGLLTFMCFMPWENICGYRWNKEFRKGKTYYSLQLKPTKVSFKTWFTGHNFIGASIKVSECQIDLLNAVLKEHNISYMRHM